MPNYLRNQDDFLSDPEILTARHKIGRSVFFEVELTLSEEKQKEQSMKDPSKFNMALSLESNSLFRVGGLRYFGGGGFGGGEEFGCPEVSDYIWVGKPGEKPYSIRVMSLLKKEANFLLYNPITRNFNKIIKTELLIDREILQITSAKGQIAKVSTSHKIIKNTNDKVGEFLFDHAQGSEVLVTKREVKKHKAQFNLYSSMIIDMKNIGRGDVVEIELEKEFIYASGSTPDNFFLGHNRKDGPGGEIFL